jgi:hypothetical protein
MSASAQLGERDEWVDSSFCLAHRQLPSRELLMSVCPSMLSVLAAEALAPFALTGKYRPGSSESPSSSMALRTLVGPCLLRRVCRARQVGPVEALFS